MQLVLLAFVQPKFMNNCFNKHRTCLKLNAEFEVFGQQHMKIFWDGLLGVFILMPNFYIYHFKLFRGNTQRQKIKE